MAKHLFILGAGASVDSGAPLMKDFLDNAQDLLNQGLFGEQNKEIQKLFDFRSKLRLVYANSTLDLRNVESVLGALEMGITTGGAAGYTKTYLRKLLRSAQYMIVRTLQELVKFPVISEEHRLSLGVPNIYKRFITQVKKRFKTDVAFITLNYDIVLDLAIISQYVGLDYSLERNNHQIDTPYLLKLHGSLNWGFDPKTKHLYTYALNKYLKREYVNSKPNEMIKLQVAEELEQTYSRKLNPLIVPPTWNKTEYHRAIPNVWHTATELLSTASNIYVIGYSLPESDYFFRYLFALGTMRNDNIRRFIVTDIDDSVADRFQNLIGSQLQSRFERQNKSFDDIGRYSGIKIFN